MKAYLFSKRQFYWSKTRILVRLLEENSLPAKSKIIIHSYGQLYGQHIIKTEIMQNSPIHAQIILHFCVKFKYDSQVELDVLGLGFCSTC